MRKKTIYELSLSQPGHPCTCLLQPALELWRPVPAVMLALSGDTMTKSRVIMIAPALIITMPPPAAPLEANPPNGVPVCSNE
jgi:hypothetical protein